MSVSKRILLTRRVEAWLYRVAYFAQLNNLDAKQPLVTVYTQKAGQFVLATPLSQPLELFERQNRDATWKKYHPMIYYTYSNHFTCMLITILHHTNVQGFKALGRMADFPARSCYTVIILLGPLAEVLVVQLLDLLTAFHHHGFHHASRRLLHIRRSCLDPAASCELPALMAS